MDRRDQAVGHHERPDRKGPVLGVMDPHAGLTTDVHAADPEAEAGRPRSNATRTSSPDAPRRRGPVVGMPKPSHRRRR